MASSAHSPSGGIDIIFHTGFKNKYSLTALVAALEGRCHDFNVIFARDSAEIQRALLSRSADKKIVAYSFMTFDAPVVKDEIYALRNQSFDGEIVFVAGGAHASGMPDTVLNWGFDYVFVGEAEISFTDFVRGFQQGNLPENKIIRQKERTVLDDFSPFSRKYNLFMPIEIMRGCPFGCRYCQVTYIFGLPQYRSVGNIIAAVEIMKQRGFKDFRFIAPNSLGYMSENNIKPNIEALRELLKGLHRTVGPDGRIFFGSFPSEVRPEFVTEETAALLKQYCSNRRIVVGAQTCTDRLLKDMHRQHSIEQVFDAVKVLKKFDFTVVVDIITGIEEPEDIEAVKAFIWQLLDLKVVLHMHTLVPLPGTPWASKKVSVYRELYDLFASLEGRGLLFGNWKEQYRFVLTHHARI